MSKTISTTTRTLSAVFAASLLWALMSVAPAATWASSGGCSQVSPCSLVFTADGQPADATANATITSAFNSQGGPIKVEIVQSGTLDTNAKASITLSVTPTANPGNGTLSGTTTMSTTGGIASFSDLSIDQQGFGYTLTATSRTSGISPGTSNFFNIWGSLPACSTSPCSGSQSTATTTGTVTTSSAAPGQLLGTAIGGINYTCGGAYKPLSDPFAFDVLSTSGQAQPGAQFTAVLRVDKSTVQSSGHPGASSWQICYASQSTFTARDDTGGTATIGGAMFHTGLLPDCPNTNPVAPCVQARTKDNAGDVLVTFLASGDPVGKG